MTFSNKVKIGLLVFFSFSLSASELDLGFDSKYVSEGRNNLAKGGIVWVTGAYSATEQLSLNIAYGQATHHSVDYDEMNLGIEYSSSIGRLDYSIGVTRLEFFSDHQHDNEISASFKWQESLAVIPFVNFVYSTQAGGAHIESGVESNYQISSAVTLLPYLLIAYDAGYAGSSSDGFNHTAIGGSVEIRLTENYWLYLLYEHTISGSDIKNSGLADNQSWAGLHMTYRW